MIITIIILIITIIIIQKTTSTNNNLNNKKNDKTQQQTLNEINYKKYYTPKRYITTKTEMQFYTILLEIAKELDVIVFSQVVLYNIVKTNENLDYKTKMQYFNKISSKSIDFVLVRKKDCKIMLCIELDDSTHQNIERQKRDIFINKLFKDLEINLLRYPVYKKYYKETLKKRIKENMKNHYYNN